MSYACETTTLAGFTQQLAVSYVANGYFFYVLGSIPEGKDPARTDAKLIDRYGIDCSKFTRARRKRVGLANVQYIRFRNRFVLLATHGDHRFFQDEATQIRDVRREPLKVEGYAVSFRAGKVSVRIQRDEYELLKSHFLDQATHRSAAALADEFAAVPYQPYAPVRGQLLCIWRAVNRARKEAGFEPVPITCVPSRRRIVKPFVMLADTRGEIDTPPPTRIDGSTALPSYGILASGRRNAPASASRIMSRLAEAGGNGTSTRFFSSHFCGAESGPVEVEQRSGSVGSEFPFAAEGMKMTTSKKLKMTEIKIGSKMWEAFPDKLVAANMPDKVNARGFTIPHGYTPAWVASYLESIHSVREAIDEYVWSVYRAAQKRGVSMSVVKLTNFPAYTNRLDKLAEMIGEEPGGRYLDDDGEEATCPRWSAEDGEPTKEEYRTITFDGFHSVLDTATLTKWALYTLRLKLMWFMERAG